MLKREHYESGVGCNDLQQEFREEYVRDGVREIFFGDIERNLLTLSAMLKPRRIETGIGRPKLIFDRLKEGQLIVDHRKVDVLMLSDRPIKDPRPKGKRIETLVTVQTGYLDEEGHPSVGGFHPLCHKVLDFTRGPVQPYQAAVTCHDIGDLKCLPGRSGMFRVRRIGDWVDLCVGDFSKHKVTPVILYRLDQSLFQGGTPSVIVEGCDEKMPLENGQMIDIGPVKPGDTLLTLRSKVTYEQARFDNKGRPMIESPRGRVLPASLSQRPYFATLNWINRLHNDLTLLPPEEQPEDLPVASQWAWGALVEFPCEVADQITFLPGFEITQALKADFLKAVGPNGTLALYADKAGTIADIGPVPEPHLLQIRYEDGHLQMVPVSALLCVERNGTDKMLEPGDSIEEGERIGYPCSRLIFNTWEMVEATFGDNLHWIIGQYLQESSIKTGEHGWKGHGTLVDWRYALPVIEHASLDGTDRPLWCWDFRAAADYLNDQGFLICPPITLTGSGELDLILNKITYFLGEPGQAERQQLTAKRRDRRRRKKEMASLGDTKDNDEEAENTSDLALEPLKSPA